MARAIAWCTAGISSSTISTCLQRAPSAMPRLRAVGDQRRRPRRAGRPRSASSSRTTRTSKCSAATAPSSRMSSSRRSPAVATTPMRCGLARSRGLLALSAELLDEVAEHPHPGRVVAVVDDDLDAVDVDLVEPAGGQVVRRGERAQALPDVVQLRAGREGGAGGGQRVLHVHLRLAAERRRQQVGPGQLHRRGGRAGSRSSRRARCAPACTARPPRRQWSSTISTTSLPASAIVNQTTSPEQRRRIAAHQRVVGVQHREPVARHGLDDDLLDLGQLLEGVDAAHARGGRARR